jgi:AcrR family transcriptional regulator
MTPCHISVLGGVSVPSQTFFNLAVEKRSRLMKSVRTELARVPFEGASINRIVRSAGISRGSFYQYFENKQDMLDYLLLDFREMLAAHALESLRQSGGDLFRMLLDIFDYSCEIASDQENGKLFLNLFSDVRINSAFLEQRAGDNILGIGKDELRWHVNTGALDIQGDRDFEDMMGVLLALTGEAFAQVFFNPAVYPERRARYRARLELVKRGFLKEKGGPCSDISP